jgi:hypothetical protein
MGNTILAVTVSNPNIAADIKGIVGRTELLPTIFDAYDVARIVQMSDMVDAMTEDVDDFCTRHFEGYPMFAFAICSGKVANIQDITLSDFFIRESRWLLTVSTASQNMFDLQRI